jgi:hypothetical protein
VTPRRPRTIRPVRRFAVAALLLVAGADVAVAQSLDPAWTVRFGGEGNENVFDLAAAPDGSAYLVGGAQGELERPVEGIFDAFVHALGADGAARWTRQLGTPGWDVARGAAVAPNGDLVVAGYSEGDFAGPNAGGSDAWALRLAPDGEEVWRIGLASAGDDELEAVVVGDDGTIYLAGATTGELAEPNAGGWDALLVALAPDGSERWRVQAGTAGDDRAYVVAPVAGVGVDLGLHAQGDLGGANEGGWDGLVRRYDADGELVWQHALRSPDDVRVLGLAAGRSGDVAVAGAGPASDEDGGSVPGFVRVLGADGSERWAASFGPARPDMRFPVAVAGDGSVWVAATTEDALAGPQAGVADAALLVFGPDGSERSALQFGSPRFDDAVALAAVDGAVLVAGTSQGPLPGAPDDAFDSDGYLMRFAY